MEQEVNGTTTARAQTVIQAEIGVQRNWMLTTPTKPGRESGDTATRQKEGNKQTSHANFHGSTVPQGVHGTQGAQTQTMTKEEIGVQQNSIPNEHSKPGRENGVTVTRNRLSAMCKVSLKVVIWALKRDAR